MSHLAILATVFTGLKAKWLRNPLQPLVPSRVYGEVCDTAEELGLTENMEFTRARMAGAVLFPGPYEFTVAELPVERAVSNG